MNMSIELAALIFSITGPLATAYFGRRMIKRNTEGIDVIRTNDMVHLEARLTHIEERMTRVENWMFEQRKNA
jgi:hypothetical protein